MRADLVLVSDGLDGAAPWLSQVLREAGLNVEVTSAAQLGTRKPADVVLLRIPEHTATETCWALHRQGHRSVVAISSRANSAECIKVLNAGADYYLDAWMPKAELVARIRVVLRFAGWLDRHPAASVPA